VDQGEAALDDLPKPHAVRLNRASGRVHHPASPDEIKQIRAAVADQRTSGITLPAPVFRYLTVGGLVGDARTQTRLRAKILVAHRLAAAGRALTYQPGADHLILGIGGGGAESLVVELGNEIKRLARHRKWTINVHPENWAAPDIAEESPDLT